MKQTILFTNHICLIFLKQPARATVGWKIAVLSSLQVVFRDLAEDFAGLYVHDVQHSRMGPLLQAVDDKLGNLCSTAEMEVHSLLAQTLLQTSLDAIIRVLLHGGPNRQVCI